MSVEKKGYKVFTLRNYKDIPQISSLSDSQKRDIEVVGAILPFKVNNYVIDELIDWNDIPKDPIFQLTFPQKGMLSEEHYKIVDKALQQNLGKAEIKKIANKIREELNPNPAGQESNVPVLDGEKLHGLQHKYRETLLFFPSSCQTCHAYCTFCFRWPQFVGNDELKFAMRESSSVINWMQKNPKITDILITGGDPMVMSAKKFAEYIDPILSQKNSHLQTIRIGTKSLGYWPYRFLTDDDADEMLAVFEKIVGLGYNLAIMAHFNHINELKTTAVQNAIKRIRATGAQIYTQSPVMKHINDDPIMWKNMWNKQVSLGCIPYYMFIARDTGAQDYFAVTLERTWEIFRTAYMQISGIGRTVRGPSMSANLGKIQVLGVNEIMGEKVFSLQFIQGRKSEWIKKPFFAKYDPKAIWIDDLKPAFGEEKFFFED